MQRRVLYPIEEVLKACGCHYLNNTVSYAVAFAIWIKLVRLNYLVLILATKVICILQAGRASVEFWLGKAMNLGTQVEVAHSSYLLDTAIPQDEKLYGYHRLEDPLVVITDENGHLVPKKRSEVMQYRVNQNPY